jgi:hypothetical protein
MKIFLARCLLFGIPVLVALAGVGFLADGYLDPFYLRLTSPRQNALIIGSSRAAQGIQPDVINQALAHEYPQTIYNFSFTVTNSPSGKVYFDAIRKKLAPNVKNSFFIVSVDPWSVASVKEAPEDSTQFFEQQTFLGNTPWVNIHPNYIYLIRNYPMPYLTILTVRIHRQVFHDQPSSFLLHDNGWLEAFDPTDSLSEQRHIRSTLSSYRSYQSAKAVSHTRIAYLVKTIRFLQQYGDVYLIRMPVHPDLLAIEKAFLPSFDNTIDSIARLQQIPYFNFTDSCSSYSYLDGSHLDKNATIRFSRSLARRIIEYRHTH